MSDVYAWDSGLTGYSRPDGQSMDPSLVRVNKLLKQREELADLCGEMIATLTVEGNRGHKIVDLEEQLLPRWRERFGRESIEPV